MKVIFLDRDGTINEEVNYLHRPEDLHFIPGVPEALARLCKAGFALIVVTNQAGIARGYYTEADCEALHVHMNAQLAAYGAHIDAFYYCPHHPVHGVGAYKLQCHCRKPETGMFEQALADIRSGRLAAAQKSGEALQGTYRLSDVTQACSCETELELQHSFMLGDKRLDTEAGHRFGLKSILLGSGYGKAERTAADGSEFDRYFETMEEAVAWILEQSEKWTV